MPNSILNHNFFCYSHKMSVSKYAVFHKKITSKAYKFKYSLTFICI